MRTPSDGDPGHGPAKSQRLVRIVAAAVGVVALGAVIVYSALQEQGPAVDIPALFAQSRALCQERATADPSIPAAVVARMQSFCACEGSVLQDAFSSDEALAAAIAEAGITAESEAGFAPLIEQAFASEQVFLERVQACADALGEPEE